MDCNGLEIHSLWKIAKYNLNNEEILLKIIIRVCDVKQDSFISTVNLSHWNTHATHNPKDAQCLQMQRSKERQLCKPHGQENKALPTAPSRLHVFGEVSVEAPRELLKVQRLLSTSAVGWRSLCVELLVFSWEKAPGILLGVFPSVKAKQAKCRECPCWSRTQWQQWLLSREEALGECS